MVALAVDSAGAFTSGLEVVLAVDLAGAFTSDSATILASAFKVLLNVASSVFVVFLDSAIFLTVVV